MTTTAISPASSAVATRPQTLELINGRIVKFDSNDALEADYVPIIDVSRLYSADLADRQALAEEIGWAARNVGFLTIVNHVSIFSIKL